MMNARRHFQFDHQNQRGGEIPLTNQVKTEAKQPSVVGI